MQLICNTETSSQWKQARKDRMLRLKVVAGFRATEKPDWRKERSAIPNEHLRTCGSEQIMSEKGGKKGSSL